MVQKKQVLQILSRKPIRPIERQKMRAWLMDRLNDGDVKGLEWHNKGQETFKISWKHAARQGWTADADADLFERWAKHTGKYVDGDEPDPKRWKANFRCALNSLPDVEEQKSMSIRRGSNAFKVYRFCKEKIPRRRSHEVEVKAEPKEESVATKSRRKMPVRASRPKSYKDMEIDSDDSSSDYAESLSGGESPAHTELSTSGSDCDSLADEHNRNDIQELPDFSKICDQKDYESLKPLLNSQTGNCSHHSAISLERLRELVQLAQEMPPHEETETMSDASSDITDEELVELILDQETIMDQKPPSKVVDEYLQVLSWNDPSVVTVAPFVSHEEEVMTSQTVIICETPSVKTEQMFDEQQMDYTSLAVL